MPAAGGGALFAWMYAAYEALVDRMKRYLEGLTAVHDGEHAYRGTYANLASRTNRSIRAPNIRWSGRIR